MVSQGRVATDDHCKVVWTYCGFCENVPEMYDKPRRLCQWWVNEHRRDSQFARGRFYITSIINETKTS